MIAGALLALAAVALGSVAVMGCEVFAAQVLEWTNGQEG